MTGGDGLFGDEPLEIELRDGTPVLVRRLIATDRQALAEAYQRLSPEARYHRFWTRTGEMIGDRMLDRILDQNRTTHAAWAVVDPARAFPGIGAAGWMQDCGASGEWDGYKLVYRWDLEDLKQLPVSRAAAELAAWLAKLAPRILG